jgi:DNA-binding XRE family transcriptional regulator
MTSGMEARLENTVRARREGLGLSQQALAERVGVSRQAIVAIEAGRQVPSTALALLLAQVLGTPVEALFRLAGQGELTVRWWGDGAEGAAARAAVGQVEGRWVGHPLGPDATVAADGVLVGHRAGRRAASRPSWSPSCWPGASSWRGARRSWARWPSGWGAASSTRA